MSLNDQIVSVCKEEDDFVFEKPRWIAHLSNGEKIYQDDERPGTNPASAWLRLGMYVTQNQLNIVNLTLQFRSNHIAPLPANADGYYFINGFASVQGGISFSSYIVGSLINNQLTVHKFTSPAFEYLGTEIRSVENAGESLIRNRGPNG